MNKAAYAGGIVRIITTLVGGWLAQKGWATEADVEGIAGAVILVATGVWSIWSKRKALKQVTPVVKATLALVACTLFLSGCAVVSGKAGESRYTGFAFGEKASSTLAGLNITETQTDKGKIVTERGVGVDQAGTEGQADIGKIFGNLLLLGLQSQGIPVKAAAVSSAAEVNAETQRSGDAETDTAPKEEEGDAFYSADGYGGSPGADGSGVYGRPSCARCRAYRAAHPGIEIVNFDTPEYKAAMWAALKARGYKGTSAALPVEVTAAGYATGKK